MINSFCSFIIGLQPLNVRNAESSFDDTKEIVKILKKKFPEIKSPIKEDICYETTNRQLAVKKIASLCDIIFVIGSNNSSNSQFCSSSPYKQSG